MSNILAFLLCSIVAAINFHVYFNVNKSVANLIFGIITGGLALLNLGCVLVNLSH